MEVRNIVGRRLASVARRARGGLAIGLVAMLAATGTLVGGSTAHAEPVPLADGFENNPNSRWGFASSGTGIAFGFLTDRGRQRSGRVNAVLHATTGFVAVGRQVQIDPPGAVSNCFGFIWVDPAAGTVTVNLEVIDPVTFQYISLNTVTFSNDPGYTQLGFNGFRWRAEPVLFRVALLGNGSPSSVYLDDMLVRCLPVPR
jgi:hypothetical protein